VRLPLQVLLLVGRNGLQRDELVETVEQRVTLRTPRHRVDRLVRLHQVCPEVSVLGPDLEAAILACGGEGAAVIAPPEGNH